jgi:hypothetical protein
MFVNAKSAGLGHSRVLMDEVKFGFFQFKNFKLSGIGA